MHQFILLLKRQWFEHHNAWQIGVAVIAAITVFLFLLPWQWQTSFNGDTSHGIFLIMLFGGGTVFMSGILKDLGNKQRGTWLLNLPASAGSKIGVALAYGILGYLVVYFALFYGVKAIVIAILVRDNSSWGQFDLFSNGFYQFLFTFIAYQSVILLGSVYFNKGQLLKTLLVMLIGLTLLFNGNSFLLKLITGEHSIDSNMPIDSFQFVFHNENIYVRSPEAVQAIVSVLDWVLIPDCLWAITWFRLKEKEL
jgi:hypothetical protein